MTQHETLTAKRGRKLKGSVNGQQVKSGEPKTPLPSPVSPLSGYKTLAKEFPDFPGIDPVAMYHNNIVSHFAREYVTVQEKELSKYGMGLGRHTCLGLIYWAGKEGISPAALADRMGVTRGAMTGLIDSLEREGWISRENHPSDRRMVRLVITDDGRKKYEQYHPHHATSLSKFMNTLTKQEQKQLVQLLRKLSSGFERLLQP